MQKETIRGEASGFKSRRFQIPANQVHRDRKKAEKTCRGQKHRHADYQ